MKTSPNRGRYALLWAGVSIVIIYGSLFPFHFAGVHYPGGPIRTLISTWPQTTGRGDALANICLYIPFAWLGMLSIAGPRLLRISVVTIMGALLSTSMELLQLYDAGRCATMSDIRSNVAGSVLGALFALVVERFWPQRNFPQTHIRMNKPALVPLVCWAGYRLFPYVPVIDLHKYWHAIRPLLTPQSDWVALCRHTAAWLAVAALLGAVCPAKFRRVAPLLAFLFISAARVAIFGAILSASEIAGGAIAIAIWVLYAWRAGRVSVWIAVVFAVNIAIQGLAPFHFVAEQRPFTWIPFYGFIESDPYNAVPSFLEKGFTFGALFWLLNQAGGSRRKAVLLGTALVAAVTFAHLYLPGRSVEITDCILFLSFALIEWVLQAAPAQAKAATDRNAMTQKGY